ncbi:hypothetical protein ABZP36_012812 [Zizania latifolia]
MFHGGTNFGRTAGGPFITTSYDYDAPLDEYGLVREPKYGTVKLREQSLVSADPTVTTLGSMQEITILTHMQKFSSIMSITTFHLGQSASFLTAKMSFLTLQQLA